VHWEMLRHEIKNGGVTSIFKRELVKQQEKMKYWKKLWIRENSNKNKNIIKTLR
jgi:hypothetical protein